MTSERRRIFAILPAGGAGTRMKLASPQAKVMLPLAGAPILERSLRTLRSVPAIEHIVIAAPEALLSEVRERYAGERRISVVAGGAERQDSVREALREIVALEDALPSAETFVLVHDAARCLVTAELVSRCIEAAITHGAVTAALPQIDSLKRVREDKSVECSVPRANLWAVQTPQVFRLALLREAHEKGPAGATDDASLVEAAHPVFVVEGERFNLKITTPEDLRLAEIILSASDAGVTAEDRESPRR